MKPFDVAIIGGGIAGCALAAYLPPSLRVLLLEREPQPGYHATGRSAAAYSQVYGGPAIRALTRASRAFLFEPPADFSDAPLVAPRGVLYLARRDQLDALHAFAAAPDVGALVEALTPAQACERVPCLRDDYIAGGFFEAGAGDVDVHALQQGYLRRLRARGGVLVTQAGVNAIERTPSGWQLATAQGTFRATLLVNAAGAWADEVARLARVAPLGLQPLRRTACTVDVPAHLPCADWPLVVDIGGEFYFKPDAGRLLLSPADETPSAPCDAWPEDADVALAVDRLERATRLSITHVRHKWAGLRSFFRDREPAIGFDPCVPDFFWVAGLGGYGIQTAPAAGCLAAALLQGQPPPGFVRDQGLRLSDIDPLRLLPATPRAASSPASPESPT